MAGNIRDWTARYCFDMFGVKKMEIILIVIIMIIIILIVRGN